MNEQVCPLQAALGAKPDTPATAASDFGGIGLKIEFNRLPDPLVKSMRQSIRYLNILCGLGLNR